jgi:GNAT superfamily N-acetyltransferase
VNRVEVRRATRGDSDAIVRLWREMMELHQEIEPANRTVVPDADEIFRSYLAKCLDDPEHMIAVAVSAGELVAFIHASRAYRPPVITPQAQGAVNGIGVTANARPQGIGRMLVEEAMKWFREHGLAVAKAGRAVANPLSAPFWIAQRFRPYQVTGLRPVELEGEQGCPSESARNER